MLVTLIAVSAIHGVFITLPPSLWTSSMVLTAYKWSIPGSRPISFMTVMPASFALWERLWAFMHSHYSQPRLRVWYSRLVILQHGRRNIGCGNNMLLVSDSSLDHLGVVDIGDQTDNQVMLSDKVSNSLVAVDVAFDGLGTRELCRQSLCILQCTTGYSWTIRTRYLLDHGLKEIWHTNSELVLGSSKDILDSGSGNEARTEQKNVLTAKIKH